MDNYRFVALGDLVADCYYRGNNLIGIDGGGSRFNVIANLADRSNPTAVIGGCGNDEVGRIIIDGLTDLGVDISNVYLLSKKTRIFNLSINEEKLPNISYTCSKKSPIDGTSTWYENSMDDFNSIKRMVKREDIVILDEGDDFSMNVINELNNDLVIDLGNINYLKNIPDEQIIKLANKFEIMNLNERVATYLIDRFKLSSTKELYDLLNPKLLVVTYGSKGAVFIYSKNITEKKLTNVSKEVDPTGAGDAFLSVLVEYYYIHDKYIDSDFVDEAFQEATNLTSEVVKYYGGRGHIHHRHNDISDNRVLKYGKYYKKD